MYSVCVSSQYLMISPPPLPTEQCVEDDGTVYEEGDEIPDPDPCTTCHCYDGEKICAVQDCAPTECGAGYKLVFLPDQCCPVCQKGEYL